MKQMRHRPISEATWERAGVIRDRLGEGVPLPEIAAALGISRGRAFQIAVRFKLRLPPRHNRRYTFNCPERHARVIEQIAKERGVNPSEVIRLLVTASAMDGVESAKRRISKLLKSYRGVL